MKLTVRYTCPVPSLRLLSLEYYEEELRKYRLYINLPNFQLSLLLICKLKCVSDISHYALHMHFHDLSKLFSSHEVYRFRRALPCFYPGKVTVTIIRSKRGGIFKMLL